MKEVSAIILAAGKGTRMKSEVAKVLHPLLGKPMIGYPVDAARNVGAGTIVCVVGHQGEAVREALAAPGVSFAVQEEQRGTADAVGKARPALADFTGAALILCGDVPLLTAGTMRRLLDEHRAQEALVTVLTMEPGDPKGYGRIVRDSSGNPAAIVEEKDADEATRAIGEVNTGTYAVELPWLWEAVGKIGSDNAQGEFYLTDMVSMAAKSGRAAALKLDDPEEAMGINSRVQLAEAAKAMRARINRAWMEEGVTLEDPDTTWIGPDVNLSPDVTIGPGCRIEGKTVIGEGSRIETGSIISDSTIGRNVRIKPYCTLDGATFADGSQAGPFANLRPGAEIGEAARVGNFVEVKKSKLHRGVKANHLTYIGDAEIGEETNVGAGTITCNYDGTNKHRTVVGRRAFIGSNTSLVAPVTVGDDAVVGAGSTITKDVPGGALGVTRAQQKNVEGWKDRKPPKGGEG